MLDKLLKLTRRLPKPVDPDTHAGLDYLTISAFLLAAGLSWNGNKRAAVAALINGGFVLGYSMFTDYSGSARRAISFPTHGKLDIIQAGMALTMPTLMGFGGTKAAKFFHGQALNETSVIGVTDWYRDHAASRLTRAA